MQIAPLKKAVQSLKEILKQPINEYVRDGVTQRFEYTFELSWKFMKRYFKEIGREDIPNGPKPVIREAGKEGLINDVESWLDFLEMRNITVHVYNENQAEKVYHSAKTFPSFVDELIKELEKRDVT